MTWITAAEFADRRGMALSDAQTFLDRNQYPKIFRQRSTLYLV